MIVSNSSPVIILGKQGKLVLLKQCFGEIVIPSKVYEEVNRYDQSPEALSLQKALHETWIRIMRPKIHPHLQTKNIGDGEKEAISLAAELKALVLLDDDIAKRYATLFGVEAHGTLFVLIRAYAKKYITTDEALHLLDIMIRDGFYISTPVYALFLDILKKR